MLIVDHYLNKKSQKQTRKQTDINPLPQAAISANSPKIRLQDLTKRPNESRKDENREKEIQREQEKTVIKTPKKANVS